MTYNYLIHEPHKPLESYLFNRDYESTSSLVILTDYIFKQVYTKLLSKFKFEYNSEDKSNTLLYLNPYLRAIYILTSAKSYIAKMNPNNIIDDTNVLTYYLSTLPKKSEDSTFLKLYEFNGTDFEIKCYNPYSNKHHIDESFKICSIDFTQQICKYLRYLLRFNGEITISAITYKNVEINSELFDYNDLISIAKIYIDDYTKYQPEIPDNMFDDHYEYHTFVDSLYNLFYYLQLQQMILTPYEETMLKTYISQLIIDYITKYDLDAYDEIPQIIDDFDDIIDDFDDTIVRPKIEIISKKSLSLVEFNASSLNKILVYDKTYDDYIMIKGNISKSVISTNTKLSITTILNNIKDIYGIILNINPSSVKFKTFVVPCVDPFDSVYSYEMYKNIYNYINFN